MSISFQDLQQATTIDDRDQLLIWQNSSGRNRRITRAALAGSRGFGASIVGVVKDDELAPNTPSGLTVSTGTETAQDGTERVYIRASINANTESDLDSYAWSIRRVSGTPTFDQAGNLTGYGGAGQAFDPVITVSKTSPNSSDGTRMQWDVSANVWYEVRVRSIDRAGNASAFTPLNSSTVKISAKDNSIPLAPTNITINSAVRSVFLKWTNASDRDLAGVKIYRSNNQKLIASASRNGVEVTVNTTTAHGFSNADPIIIAGLSAGTVNPNGQKAGNYAWAITVLSSTSFKYSLPSGTGTENYTVSDGVAIPFSNSSLIWNGYADSYTDTSITEQEQGTTFYYRLTSFDYSGNESVYQSAVKKVTPGQIDATDVKDFAITATKRWNNTIVLEGDQWFDQKSDSTTTLQNSIAWNQHSLYYQGVKYTVAAGNVLATTQIPASTGDRVAYVYATIPASGTSITYQTHVVTPEDDYPELTDSQFMIATNVNGVHDLAWNALANAVIGSAWIQNAAITNAKIKSLAADKIDAGTIESKEIVLGGGGVFKSSGAASFSSGSGFWLEGGAGDVTKFGIGDLSGNTHGYLKWNQNENTLSIKGEINATSGTFGSGFGTANTTGVKVDSSGLLLLAPSGAGNNGRIAAKIDWATNAFAPINTSGFYLGGNNDIYRFFIGQTGTSGLGGNAYLYWNGSSLTINGTILGTSTINGFPASTVVTNDGVAPATPAGTFTVTSVNEKSADGTEKVYIRAVLGSATNNETDFAKYRWYIRRASGTPEFSGGTTGNLTGYGGTAQIFGPTITETPKTDANALQMSWEVKAYEYYEVAVAAVDTNGNVSNYTALTHSTVIRAAKDTNAPNAPTAVSATSAIKSVFLSWTNPTDSDLAFIKIYRVQTDTATVPSVPAIGPAQAGYARIMSNSYVDSNTIQGKYYHYWLTSVDTSGNESSNPSAVVSISPGLVANTDITTFAVDATKMFTNTVVLKGDAWVDDSNNGVQNSAAGYIYWNEHTLVYGGQQYTIAAGFTNLQFVYWTGGGVYQKSDTNPTLSDGHFMIATNAKNDLGVAQGKHDLAWNAIANAVIGSAYIQNAAITNAKINDLAVDKLTGGSISGQIIELTGDSIIKSSSATSGTNGSGLWIKGLAGGGSEFAIGDLSGTNYGYLRWLTSTNSLVIKGSITATSLTLTGVGDAATIAKDGLESTIQINTGGISMGTGGFVRGGIDWETNKFSVSQSGFFLGKANVYRFFIGETGTSGLGGGNYLYWNGSSLDIGGTLSARSSGNDAGGAGLTIRSGFGIRYFDKSGVLTITGGDENGVQGGSQIDFVGVDATGAAGQANGQLVLSAGYKKAAASNAEAAGFTDPYDGSIVFRTSYGSFINSGANLIGVRRLIIERDGTVTVGSQGDTAQSGAPDSGSGKLVVETSVEAPTYTSTSSKRFKKKIKNLKNGLETLSKLRPVVFDWRTKDLKNDIGLIAEEVNEVVPNLVGLNNKGEIMGIDYGKLTPILIQAVKELALEVERLKNKIG